MWYKRKKRNIECDKKKKRSLDEMSYWELIHILDREYSFNLRAGEAVQRGTAYVHCYTCGKITHWKESDCGHFINRDYMGVRFDLRNTRIQCRKCNRFSEGAKGFFAIALMRDGIDIEKLEAKANVQGKKHLPCDELIQLIAEYRKKNKALRKKLKTIGGK